MWNANKGPITALLIGLLLLAAAYAGLNEAHPDAARKVVATGFCLLLLIIGCVSWLSVGRGTKPQD